MDRHLNQLLEIAIACPTQNVIVPLLRYSLVLDFHGTPSGGGIPIIMLVGLSFRYHTMLALGRVE